jgi:hypothetical protein
MNDEVPMGAGAVIVDANTGEVTEIPFTEEQLAEIEMVNARLVVDDANN